MRHLFEVSSSLDSMVVGEPQILAQVNRPTSGDRRPRRGSADPLRLSSRPENCPPRRHGDVAPTAAGKHPQHCRGRFAQQIFERFDDKKTLVIGAGEMADETLRYLRDEGIREVVVVNRSYDQALALAQRWQGRAMPWDQLSRPWRPPIW